MSELRDDIATALERERDRCEQRAKLASQKVKSRQRIAQIDSLLEKLEDKSREVFLTLEPELRPWEIRL